MTAATGLAAQIIPFYFYRHEPQSSTIMNPSKRQLQIEFICFGSTFFLFLSFSLENSSSSSNRCIRKPVNLPTPHSSRLRRPKMPSRRAESRMLTTKFRSSSIYWRPLRARRSTTRSRKSSTTRKKSTT